MNVLKGLIKDAKNYIVKYVPDSVYAEFNPSDVEIKRRGKDWIIRGNGYSILSPTSKFTGVGMKLFESKFEQYFKIERGDVCLDVGACIGDTTVPMVLKTGNSGFVHAVEPNKLNFMYLNKNMMYYNNKKLYELAIYDKQTELTFHEHNTLTGHSIVPLSIRKHEVIVKADTLDNLFKYKKIDFAKIDVQGSEAEALRGGGRAFLPNVRKLVVECHYGYKDDTNTDKVVEHILNAYFINVEYSKQYNLFYAWR